MLSHVAVLAFCACLVVAAPQFQTELTQIPIIYSRGDLGPDGSYRWSFESGDGTKQEQSGHESVPEGGQAVEGLAEWVDPEGKTHRIQYTADERGYLPSSDDLPVGPAIPEAILRSLQWNAAHPEEETES